MKATETMVTLWTLCGCSKELKWHGLPPQEIRVPIRQRVSIEDQMLPLTRIRRFSMTDAAHPFYRFDEEPEP